jgi:NAD+ synthase (glutamine-hydrolysing)
MKLCLAQINTTIAHFDQNSQKILEGIQHAHKNGCDIVLFPELCLFGYWPSDLLENELLVQEQIKKIKIIQELDKIYKYGNI